MDFEIGNRYLLSAGANKHDEPWHVFEAQILELSPSGNWVKIKYSGGDDCWCAVSKLTIVEKLNLTKKEEWERQRNPFII
jgi:hypothetical protein